MHDWLSAVISRFEGQFTRQSRLKIKRFRGLFLSRLTLSSRDRENIAQKSSGGGRK